MRGLLIGAAAGDALGWPQEQRSGIVGGRKARQVEPKLEFRPWLRWGGTQYSRYEDPVAAGEYSDDTQLLLATARACLNGADWFTWLTTVELPVWPVYQRGGGRAVLKAGHSWESSRAPWEGSVESVRSYFASGANGVAMRIAPHVVVTLSEASPQSLVSRVVRDGTATHGHARALLGAVVHALSLRHALKRQGTMEYGDLISELTDSPAWGNFELACAELPHEWLRQFEEYSNRSFREAWSSAAKEVENLLRICLKSLQRAALSDDEETLGALGCFDKSVNGSGTITAVAASYLAARFAARPSMGLLRSAFLPSADTDTLASMTGSLLGALHGPDWLASLSGELQDFRYLSEISEKLILTPSRRVETASGDRSTVKEWLRSLGNGREMKDFVDGRGISEVHVSELKSSTRQQMERYRVTLEDGQSLIIDRREAKGKSVSRSVGVSQDSDQLEFPEHEKEGDALVPTRIAVHVADLASTRRFYGEILGVRLTVSEQVIYVTPWLAFLQHPNMPGDLKSGPIQITITSSDTGRVKNLVEKYKIPLVPPGPRDVDGSLRVIDPDGNEVLIWPTGREHRRL
ncbi:ADP-ribosylglycohydrolase family protein [Streptomyces sp. NPDC058642]|uniref:ADP-ribosylglycohydrolase family protein n=1 Tax=Streptomyces sp. NPDC058642 TaxID=3346572 RepID=UPI003662BBC7